MFKSKNRGEKRKAAPHEGAPANAPMDSYYDEATIPCPKIISVFNFKGGVGKTTIVSNLVAMLSETGDGVVAVDCDSQANLTTLFRDGGTPRQARDPEPEDEPAEELDAEPDVYEDLRHHPLVRNPPEVPLIPDVAGVGVAGGIHDHDIHQLFVPLLDYGDVSSALSKAAGTDDYGSFYPPEVQCSTELYLVPGTPLLATLESEFSRHFREFEQGTSLPTEFVRIFNAIGFFRYAMSLLAYRTRAKYVVLDLGPSAGALNEMFVLSSDAVLPPIFPDRFSRSSVEGLLSHILPRWFTHHRNIVKLQALEEAKARNEGGADAAPPGKFALKGFIKFKDQAPVILPFLVSNYRSAAGRIHAPGALWVNSITDYVSRFRNSDAREKKRVASRFAVKPEDDGRETMVVPFCRQDTIFTVAHEKMRPVVWLAFDYRGGGAAPHQPEAHASGVLLGREYRARYDNFRRQYSRLTKFIVDVFRQRTMHKDTAYKYRNDISRVDAAVFGARLTMNGVFVGYEATPEPSLRSESEESEDSGEPYIADDSSASSS